MERYIDILKQTGFSTRSETSIVSERKEAEAENGQNPAVVCSVTLGKELHAGHLFLLTIGEQMRKGLNANLPLVLVNNNTGPRAAAALCNLAEQKNVSLSEAARLLNAAVIDKNEIIKAYRNRDEKASSLEEAVQVLAIGNFDMFRRIAIETAATLKQAGFTIDVTSESKLLSIGANQARAASPQWANTGFMPFVDSKRVVILEKSGNLTATGASLASIIALFQERQCDYIVTVDSMSDSADAAFIFSALKQSGVSFQIPGAGAGFEGKIASGTKGEAFTIAQILEKFLEQRPNGSLKDACLFLTLTRPTTVQDTENPTLIEAIYDFKNNDSIINLLVKCNDEYLEFNENLKRKRETLKTKISELSSAESKRGKVLLEFLPNKVKTLLETNPQKVMTTTKKFVIVKDPTEIAKYKKDFGYDENNINRILVKRNNFFFGYLENLISDIEDINSVSEKDLATINSMIDFCIGRIFI
ncbi:hypothetical protein BH10PAT1_BH10PAT1_6660 [soil metagenome]